MVKIEEQEALGFAIDLAVGKGINLLDRSLQICEEITQETLRRVDYGMSILEKVGEGPITIRLTTPGGDVYAGFGIAGRIRNSECEIVTEAYGNCMSIGAVIFAAGDRRAAKNPVLFMLHQLSAELPEDKLLGLKAAVVQLKRDQDLYVNFLTERTGTPQKVWKDFINKSDDTYLTAQDALRLNLVTEL